MTSWFPPRSANFPLARTVERGSCHQPQIVRFSSNCENDDHRREAYRLHDYALFSRIYDDPKLPEKVPAGGSSEALGKVFKIYICEIAARNLRKEKAC